MSQHVLLIGGHGKVAQFITPLLLARSYAVTSMIRDPAQSATITKLGEGQPGKLNVLVSSVEDVKSEHDARKILDQVKPSWVIWSAGAGGKGGPDRTYAVDRDAAKAFIKASTTSPSVSAFLMVSYLASRRTKPAWWSDAEWATATKLNTETLPDYAKAKIAADEYLAAMTKKRGGDFRGICLRPGTLTEGPAGGVELGKTGGSGGKVSREAVAQAAVEVLDSGYKGGWLDLLDGQEDVRKAAERVTREGVDAFEGEDAARIYALAD
ncbi:Nad dependent epimerase dehydratase family protein [Lasiodiplodia theobromae]|uniref:Nad dependent epimerase dehydratase family protein n=1 Tax=Lasiodiplodia theobromae TaxID=45133 RepID=UPI0015C356DE|nr:Nad dependent epimerase dehydratase family protein [Lasiodiplodia theobromae]KAF4542240.1 Nad dependent epimerase dehydratase family protein [Lasiodiplodia theobromae]